MVGFILRAVILIALAFGAAYVLLTRVPSDRFGRVALRILAAGIVGMVVLGIFIAAFDGQGAP